jgi:hypothetical protein
VGRSRLSLELRTFHRRNVWNPPGSNCFSYSIPESVVRVLGAALVPCVERSGEQFRYAADFGKVDDLKSGSHFPIVSFLGLAFGRSRRAVSRTDIGDN